MPIALEQAVLHDFDTDIQNNLFILIQFVDEIKTLVYNLNIYNVFRKFVFQNYYKLRQHGVSVKIQQLLENFILVDLNFNVIIIIHKNHNPLCNCI